MKDINHYTGCILGGAIGDALGAPVEFQSLQAIRRQYGPQGITGYVEFNADGLAEFTDDTQMTLFTAEGLLCAAACSGEINSSASLEAIDQAYQRWLKTQYEEFHQQTFGPESYLLRQESLWKRRAPGNTCLSALSSGKMGTIVQPINNSKGCGGVMRMAPVGLVFDSATHGSAAFHLGCEAAAITHGHPSGYLSAGFLAQLVACLAGGLAMGEALRYTLDLLADQPHHEETLQAVQSALSAAGSPQLPESAETLERLGAGWVGEEALATGLYATLVGIKKNSFAHGVLLAVNHSGDCDSTASIAGNLLGLILGRDSIPREWIAPLELRTVLEEVAAGLLVTGKDPEFLKDKFLSC